ncbi:hypothetical protein EDC64_102379 [Aquabacter spiritensis]|uniref:Uncharacterized protein n=1 Tax=Aquabacter spiritensis TaxID=933073 RepID=A0A4V2UYC8_9HYPH|nr:hypothetical protein EDC64_102379 [Aquabacter spiritensis]
MPPRLRADPIISTTKSGPGSATRTCRRFASPATRRHLRRRLSRRGTPSLCARNARGTESGRIAGLCAFAVRPGSRPPPVPQRDAVSLRPQRKGNGSGANRGPARVRGPSRAAAAACPGAGRRLSAPATQGERKRSESRACARSRSAPGRGRRLSHSGTPSLCARNAAGTDQGRIAVRRPISLCSARKRALATRRMHSHPNSAPHDCGAGAASAARRRQ